MRSLKLLLLMLLATIALYSQVENLPQPQPYFTAILVQDIDTSIEWYEKTLGLSTLNKTVLPERGFAQANLQGGTILIELIELNTALSAADLPQKGEKAPLVQGFFKIGFSIADFDRWLAFLKEMNVTFHGSVVEDKHSGKRMFIIKDPDGNRIQFFEQ